MYMKKLDFPSASNEKIIFWQKIVKVERNTKYACISVFCGLDPQQSQDASVAIRTYQCIATDVETQCIVSCVSNLPAASISSPTAKR